MTDDKNSSESGSSHGFTGPYSSRWHSGDTFAWARQPGFHPLKAVAVVAGLALFPPLGVLTLGYFLWNSKRHAWGQGGPAAAGRHGKMGGCGGRGRFTGNQAFDEHQMEEMNKLREERRAFHEHRSAARTKRDQEAYQAFRNAQAQTPADGSGVGKE